jgi:hypothetical protein
LKNSLYKKADSNQNMVKDTWYQLSAQAFKKFGGIYDKGYPAEKMKWRNR